MQFSSWDLEQQVSEFVWAPCLSCERGITAWTLIPCSTRTCWADCAGLVTRASGLQEAPMVVCLQHVRLVL